MTVADLHHLCPVHSIHIIGRDYLVFPCTQHKEIIRPPYYLLFYKLLINPDTKLVIFYKTSCYNLFELFARNTFVVRSTCCVNRLSTELQVLM